MFPYYCRDEKYRVAVKWNKRKSNNFYYRHIGYSGVEFVKDPKIAHTCDSKKSAEFLVTYLQRRIKEADFKQGLNR
jgi:hypothetical protein